MKQRALSCCWRWPWFLLAPLATEPLSPWRAAAPGYTWDFPRDLAVHPEFKTEWWYITGHLQPVDDPGAEPLGFQLTFFRSGLAPADSLARTTAWDPVDLVMAHAAVSDPVTGSTFSVKSSGGPPRSWAVSASLETPGWPGAGPLRAPMPCGSWTGMTAYLI